jgi:hypothetical protein
MNLMNLMNRTVSILVTSMDRVGTLLRLNRFASERAMIFGGAPVEVDFQKRNAAQRATKQSGLKVTRNKKAR